MKHPLIFVLFFTLLQSGWSQSAATIERTLAENEKESRLLEYKDDKEAIILKLKQVEHINKSRKRHKVAPLDLDILASRMANQIAHEAARHNYSGHFNLKGEPPYIRFANSGGTDHVTENAAAASYNHPIENNAKSISHNMQLLHDAFMAEKAPHDAHKKACIDKFHNLVGIGYAIHGKEFRYYEEYLDRHLSFAHFNHETTTKKEIALRFKPINNKQIPYFVIVFYQPFPHHMTPVEIDRIESYNDYSDTEHLNLGPWEIPQPDQTGYTTLNLKFDNKGYYYVQIFLSDTPHRQGGKASTAGKVQASGVVIKVE